MRSQQTRCDELQFLTKSFLKTTEVTYYSALGHTVCSTYDYFEDTDCICVYLTCNEIDRTLLMEHFTAIP